MSPDKEERGPSNAPSDQRTVHHDDTLTVDDTVGIPKQLRRRRDASRRLPPLEHSGRRDPWHSPPLEPTEPNREAARRAWLHLCGHGLMSEHVEAFLRECAA